MGLGASLVIYAHANFSTKSTVQRIEEYQKIREQELKEDIKDIKEDVKFIRNCMLDRAC